MNGIVAWLLDENGNDNLLSLVTEDLSGPGAGAAFVIVVIKYGSGPAGVVE